MGLAYSKMMELGTKAPDFNLFDTRTQTYKSLNALKSDVATVITFICNHCPFVHHINSKLVEIANEYQQKSIQFIAISSNNIITHPQDVPELMTKVAENENYPFPYLFDETQEVAKAYMAECTPDFYVFNKDLKCAYRGRFDDTRPGRNKATGKDLSNALNNIINGNLITSEQHPSMGCNIKWK